MTRFRSHSALVFAVAVAVASFAYLTTRPAAVPVAPIVAVGAMGWVDDPVAVEAIAMASGRVSFARTPAGSDDAPLPPAAYLWEAYRKLFGENPPGKNQNPVGSCVSFGTNTAVEHTMAVEIVAGQPFEFRRIVEEVTYGGSRVEIGGGRIRGDGSVGAWAAEWVRTRGVVPRGVHGRHDLTRYDPDLCRRFGATGVPDDLEAIARMHPVRDTARVGNWAEAKRALAQGHGIAVCSNQGFARERDSRGVCRPQGVWQHCMALVGYHTDEAGREYGRIENSWGDQYHVGPTGWGNPNAAGFWADAVVVDRMLRQGDSWTFSGVAGFPAKRIDWHMLLGRAEPRPVAKPPRRPDFAIVFAPEIAS